MKHCPSPVAPLFLVAAAVLLTTLFATAQDTATKEFTADVVGWTFSYPADWEMLDEAERQAVEAEGIAQVEKITGEAVENRMQTLIHLRKDQFNQFSATVLPFDDESGGSYRDQQDQMFETAIEAVKAMDLTFKDHTTTMVFDDLEFQALSLSVFKPGTEELLIGQLYLNRLFDEKNALTITVSYNNQEDANALMALLDSSKFSVRK